MASKRLRKVNEKGKIMSGDPCNKPGWEGCAHRLVRVWNPDAIGGAWLDRERLMNTGSANCARAFGDVIAHATMEFGRNMDDTREAILGEYGALYWYQKQLQEQINTYKRSANGLLFPK